ncbi:MAG: WD40 repeat domain-containing protein [Gaiellaceae bacterium]
MKLDLERIEIPGEHDARVRTWETVQAAFARRERVAWPRKHARELALSAAVVAVLAAAFTPPGHSVVNSIRDAVGRTKVEGVKNAHRELVQLPAAGPLLLQSARGPWVVQPSGARRFLGAYTMASWSPHAKFVAAVRYRHELVALDPKGNIRWVRGRKQLVRFPRWSYEGFRIAYLSNDTLRVITGDGLTDVGLGSADPSVPPAWKPGTHVVAWVGTDGNVLVRDADQLRAAPTRLHETKRVIALGWRTAQLVVVHAPAAAAAFAGDGTVARVVRAAGRSRVYVADHVVFSGAGAIGSLAFSPDSRWLAVGWQSADQLVFIRLQPPKLDAVSNVTRQFGPHFPTIAGWCCSS